MSSEAFRVRSAANVVIPQPNVLGTKWLTRERVYGISFLSAANLFNKGDK